MEIEIIFGDYIFNRSPIAKKMKRLDFSPEIFPIYQLNFIVTLTNT